ncbi:hypothetical protein [Streptomyces blattellae]|uniref:hypothetical protein n=1 Tax=Streptomyces blattellae TaxID=2569855 RepID=UPI0012B968B2|nr:hypothetical protein [Streptomyces blattellae]
MMVKRALRATGVLAAAAVTTLAMATSAQAADHRLETADGGEKGGSIEFTRAGDRLEVCDEDNDGWRAIAYVINPDGSERYRLPASGEGNCNVRGQADGGRYNLNENRTYRFRVCLDQDSGSVLDDEHCASRRWRAGAS